MAETEYLPNRHVFNNMQRHQALEKLVGRTIVAIESNFDSDRAGIMPLDAGVYGESVTLRLDDGTKIKFAADIERGPNGKLSVG